MTQVRKLLLLIFFFTWSAWAFAEYGPTQQKALASVPLEFKRFDFIWAFAEGDFNSDGIPDVAMLLTDSKADGPMEERLFALTGNSDGAYNALSISDDFCHPGKFYNLDIARNSVFVQMVEQADAASASSYTLQFRFNAKLNDLELIGQESLAENYEEGTEERISSNYLTGKLIHSTKKGESIKSTTERITSPVTHPKLNGYSCGRI